MVLKRLRAEKLPAFDECPDLSPYHQSSIKTYIHTKFQGDHLMLCGTLQACSFCRFHRWHLPINPSQVDLSLVSDLKRNFHIILHALMPDLQKILLDQLIVLEEPPCQVLLPARGVDDVWSCKTSASAAGLSTCETLDFWKVRRRSCDVAFFDQTVWDYYVKTTILRKLGPQVQTHGFGSELQSESTF